LRPRTDKIAAPERQVELLELIGTTLGNKYKLERLLGAGGMGGVYAARPIAGGGEVAIKVLSVADPASRERIAARFAREARAVSALSCANIVTVLDAGSEGSRPYLVMELLEGEDLGQRLRRDGSMPIDQALHVVAQVLVALGSAHEAGVVHRDLKPDNIFLSKKEGDELFTKLLDFGMSKLTPREGQTLALALTKKGMAVGTPYYMAPEQARALDDVDGRSDLWAMGAILFECLTGRPPFVGTTQEQTLISICTTDAPDVRALRPEVPSPVAKLIARALKRDRAQRFVSAWEMLSVITDVAPSERRVMPAKAMTSLDMPAVSAQPVAPVASSPDRSGPVSAAGASGRFGTIVAAPIPGLADGSGPNPALQVTAPAPPAAPSAAPKRAPSQFVKKQPPKKKSNLTFFMLGFCALVLGIGVVVYVLAITHAR
jgi:serine/threonine-protein kinase